MKTTNDTRELVYVSPKVLESANDTRVNQRSILPYVQAFLDEAKRLDIRIGTEDLTIAINHPEQFAKDDFKRDLIEAQEKPVKVGRLIKTPKNLLEGFTLPDLNKFIFLAQEVKDGIRINRSGLTYIIIDNYNASINEEGIKKIIERGSFYVESPGAKGLHAKAKAAASALNAYFDDLCKLTGIKHGDIKFQYLHEFIEKIAVNGKEEFAINFGYFARYVEKHELEYKRMQKQSTEDTAL